MSLILPASSSPELKAFPLHLRHYRSSGSAPSLPNLPRAGRVGRFASNGETVSSVSAFLQSSLRSSFQEAATPATDSPDTRISVVALVVLSDCCACGGKTLISRLNLCPSATCRGLRPCLLWHLWSVSASALQTRKPSPNTIGPPTFARLCVTASLTAISRPKGCILIISIAKGCILRLSPPDAFIV